MRFHCILSILIACGFVTRSVEAAEYRYPYRNPYLATVTTAILSGDGACIKPSILRVPGLPGRNKLPTLEGRGNVSLALYQQDRPAPLLFILAGLGANPYFGVAPYLAGLFSCEGFHVVILPSPMSWNFALSASRPGAPGFAPKDAQDLYEVMQKTLTTLRNRHNLSSRSIYFMGLSLGALEGAYLSVIDADEKKIGIRRYFLVNPPVDLAYAVKKMDEWNRLAGKFGREQSRDLVSQALGIVDSFSDHRGDDSRVFGRFVKKFAGFTTDEIQFLITETLKIQLPELIYVTQVIHDQNVLVASKNDMRKRLEEAKAFTFSDYNQKIALPLWQKQVGDPRADLDTFIQHGSLGRIFDRLRGNARVHIVHNVDDILSERKSIEALKQVLGDQVTLYPHGGHLGNLWFPENKAHALRFFRSG
jgi:pimeloyl-ACP methyl ester carboxylesterase